MSKSEDAPSSGTPGVGDLAAAVAKTVERAHRLARTPDSERDLAWHVEAFFVGDLSALVSARLREPVASA